MLKNQVQLVWLWILDLTEAYYWLTTFSQMECWHYISVKWADALKPLQDYSSYSYFTHLSVMVLLSIVGQLHDSNNSKIKLRLTCCSEVLKWLLNMSAGQHLCEFLDSHGGSNTSRYEIIASVMTRCHLLPGKAHQVNCQMHKIEPWPPPLLSISISHTPQTNQDKREHTHLVRNVSNRSRCKSSSSM